MMLHGMTLLALISAIDKMWPDAVATLIVVHPIWLEKGKVDYIAMVLNANMCHMELCTGAQDKGLQSSNGFADDNEDVIDTFQIVEAARDHVNKKHAKAASKPNKQACTKKSDATISA